MIALIRVDFNVPVHKGKILDLTRIKAAIPTIEHCLQSGMSVVLMSHFGRPKGLDRSLSLKLLIEPLSKLLKQKVCFYSSITKKGDEKTQNLNPGTVVLLENLRFYSGEIANDLLFAKKLATYGDIYINDAFGASHRDHASISAIKTFFTAETKFKGLLLHKELKELNKLKTARSPYTVIVGGAKIGSKIHILKSFLNIADNILIGGGMAFPFIKELGGEIGRSLCSKLELDVVKEFLIKSKNSKTKIVLPLDCLTTTSLNKTSELITTEINSVPKKSLGVDIGEKTISLYNKIILASKSIIWNGPMGITEIEPFSSGTRQISNSMVRATKNGAYTLIGGGDTISDVSRFGVKNEFSYICTGGGAMLEFFRANKLATTLDLKKLK